MEFSWKGVRYSIPFYSEKLFLFLAWHWKKFMRQRRGHAPNFQKIQRNLNCTFSPVEWDKASQILQMVQMDYLSTCIGDIHQLERLKTSGYL